LMTTFQINDDRSMVRFTNNDVLKLITDSGSSTASPVGRLTSSNSWALTQSKISRLPSGLHSTSHSNTEFI